jgi:hypothetical protein
MISQLSNTEAQNQVTVMLSGCSINKVSYFITGWEFRLIGEDGPEYIVHATHVSIPNKDQWWSSIKNPPVNLKDTNEPDDTIAAMNIFTVINKWPIGSVAIDPSGILNLAFTNGCVIQLLATVKNVEWSWQVATEINKPILTCDGGKFYLNVGSN